MLYIVGFGPGDKKHMTLEADSVLSSVDTIVGYVSYTCILKELYPDKEYVESGMRDEIARCEAAIKLAAQGRSLALVCSGDAGIYALAGLVFELLERDGLSDKIDVHVVPGLTAALAASALLGAPLGHDCAFISLSDLMTERALIMKRLKAAAEADFCIALYNPSGSRRRDIFEEACDLLMKYRLPDSPCGIAQRIGREGESVRIIALSELKAQEVDMQSIVLLGNESTRLMGEHMITPRGYMEKYGK